MAGILRLAWIREEPPLPAYSGGRIRSLELMTALADSAQLTLMCARSSPTQEAELVNRGVGIVAANAPPQAKWRARVTYLRRIVQGVPVYFAPYASDAHRQLVLQALSGFDAIVIDGLRNAFNMPRATGHARVTKVIDLADVESARLPGIVTLLRGPQRLTGELHMRQTRAYEVRTLLNVDVISVTSARDAERLVQAGCERSRMVIVPNAVPTSALGVERERSTANTILFVGALDYPPNVAAVEELALAISPQVRQSLPGCQFTVVGSSASPALRRLLRAASIQLHEDAPDIRPFLSAASVVAVPLRAGGGTRIKILEAMASGCPVVSTSVGVEGLPLTAGENVLIADNSVDFAAAISRLLGNDDYSDRIGRAGREFVTRMYSWDKSAERLLAAIESTRENTSL